MNTKNMEVINKAKSSLFMKILATDIRGTMSRDVLIELDLRRIEAFLKTIQ
jgi:hypothetical protein